jgi:hypothetical protein
LDACIYRLLRFDENIFPESPSDGGNGEFSYPRVYEYKVTTIKQWYDCRFLDKNFVSLAIHAHTLSPVSDPPGAFHQVVEGLILPA